MSGKLQPLPIGTYDFEKLRRMNCIYVDKTARLQELIQAGAWYFLSRPRRFGKSLTLSTLGAMFGGPRRAFQRARRRSVGGRAGEVPFAGAAAGHEQTASLFFSPGAGLFHLE